MLGMLGLLLQTGAGATTAAAPKATPAPVAYHLDCRAGDDAADGRTPETAWRSLARADQQNLRPGDSLLLLRGCRWGGPLFADWSGTPAAPITIGAYGEGDPPIIQNSDEDIDVTGSWLVIEQVHVRTDAPGVDAQCQNQPAGNRYGIRFHAGSHDNVVRDALVTELFTGIRIDLGAHDDHILDSVFINNDMKSNDPGSDSGAVAIDLQGDDNEVAGNQISGSDACSRFFNGRDGSAISVYGGRRNVVHHNVSVDNHDFIELGNPRTADTLIAYNTDHSTLPLANFVVVHGFGSRYGPTEGTVVAHNTAVLIGASSGVIDCAQTIGPKELSLRANILWGEGRLASCSTTFDEADNIYWRSDGAPDISYQISPTSRIIDPRLVDARAGDFHLQPDSPAIDAVLPMDLHGVGDLDAAGVAVPQGFGPDIGAYEFVSAVATAAPTAQSSAAPSPSPAATATPVASARLPASQRPGASRRPVATPEPTAATTASDSPSSPAIVSAPPSQDALPTPAPSPAGPPTPAATPVPPPPTGGSGALDSLLVVAALGLGGVIVAGGLLLRRRPG